MILATLQTVRFYEHLDLCAVSKPIDRYSNVGGRLLLDVKRSSIASNSVNSRYAEWRGKAKAALSCNVVSWHNGLYDSVMVASMDCSIALGAGFEVKMTAWTMWRYADRLCFVSHAPFGSAITFTGTIESDRRAPVRTAGRSWPWPHSPCADTFTSSRSGLCSPGAASSKETDIGGEAPTLVPTVARPPKLASAAELRQSVLMRAQCGQARS